MTRFFYGASHEQFSPDDLLDQAVAAERAGFDGLSASDHLQPWWEPGESGHTWVWLGCSPAAPTSARREAGRDGDGEIIFQALFSWAESDDEALEAARIWKGAQPPEHFTDDWHKPAEMYEHGEQEVSDDEFKENAIISADPEHHVERLRELEDLGATIIVLQNNSGAAPMKAIEVYGSEVLPALTRAARRA
jgi:alkanesulfonate monooxygenase SsuD/methylene tetrahydromethanopterin reductase-like flavin-dependent oxidoreductase (luciferase family)